MFHDIELDRDVLQQVGALYNFHGSTSKSSERIYVTSLLGDRRPEWPLLGRLPVVEDILVAMQEWPLGTRCELSS